MAELTPIHGELQLVIEGNAPATIWRFEIPIRVLERRKGAMTLQPDLGELRDLLRVIATEIQATKDQPCLDTFTCEDCGHTYSDEVMTSWQCDHDPGDRFCEHCLPDHVAECDPCVDRVSRGAEYDRQETAWKERNL